MRMLDQTKAFPRRTNIEKFTPLIEAAQKAAKGDDGLPKVAVEDFENLKAATQAANAIRNYVRKHQLGLSVSQPENSKTNSIFVWQAKPRTRRKKPELPPPSPEIKPVDAGNAPE